jgi:hypothetical protein
MPLFAPQSDFPGVAGELPPGKGFSRGSLSPRRPPALGTRDRLAVIGPHGWVVREILLQQPGGQFAGEGASAPFALGEGDRGRLLSAVEIEIESGLSLLQPLLSELFTGRGGDVRMFSHGWGPGKGKRNSRFHGYLTPEAQLQEREWTRLTDSPAIPTVGGGRRRQSWQRSAAGRRRRIAISRINIIGYLIVSLAGMRLADRVSGIVLSLSTNSDPTDRSLRWV